MLHSNGNDKTNSNTDQVGSNSNHYGWTVKCCQASKGINIPHSARVSSTSAIWRPYLGCRNRLTGLRSTPFRLCSGLAFKESICIIFSHFHALQFSFVNHFFIKLSRSVCAIKTSLALLESAVAFRKCYKSEQELKLRYSSLSLSIAE